MRAAEYVRVSTDHQQYSIENQRAAIAEYAACHGFEIVKTYADQARSGLDIKHRPGLQSLLDDVLAGRADFKAVLVFDVSRWGRFQDSDEAACYEFLCKRANIRVHYCAEPFTNDGTPISALFKTIKRTMAAEYSRELSKKSHAGQCRVAEGGFKMGGYPGFGLRRLLLDRHGQPKTVLQDGERKSLATDRVTYTLGPDDEVRVVREIYSMFLDQGCSPYKIARLLNERGVKYGQFGPWCLQTIRLILTHPKYAGCIVFNRTSAKLKTRTVANPPEQWVITPCAFPAIVSKEVLARALARIQDSVFRRSNERLLAELRTYVAKHSKAYPGGRKPSGLASRSTYRGRFGGMMAAYTLIGYQPHRYSEAVLQSCRKVSALRSEVARLLREELTRANVRFSEKRWCFRLRGIGKFMLVTARSYTLQNGVTRWKVTNAHLPPDHGVIVIRLGSNNDSIKDYVFYSKAPKTSWGFTLRDRLPNDVITVHLGIAEVAAAITTVLTDP